MRIDLLTLMARQKIPNALALSKASGGRIPITTAYRLVRSEGQLKGMGPLFEALCDVLEVGPGELFVRETAVIKKPVVRKTAKNAGKKAATTTKSTAPTKATRTRAP
jgi:hypothetical protein